ncbi:MAG TPA: helix-turn-helix domain-containing protein, partial [Candidatus Dormibacteraeota bacterium]|nr:helix-turn-helix domain-containing protein [Candidatus Dormibacteraeota bacterium]
DEARARAFVSRELRGIDGDDPRSRRLRRTLRAYFASAQNGSAAAALLGVHEHTVAYRLRTIEDRLGRPVAARRAELETALRLLELSEHD